ncbi:MAG: hypothetical protein ACKPKO_32955, partial [Candidatus Fonsibacter sp.]
MEITKMEIEGSQVPPGSAAASSTDVPEGLPTVVDILAWPPPVFRTHPLSFLDEDLHPAKIDESDLLGGASMVSLAFVLSERIRVPEAIVALGMTSWSRKLMLLSLNVWFLIMGGIVRRGHIALLDGLVRDVS